MATGGLYGNSPAGNTVASPSTESSGLYGNTTSFGGTYFEYLIFIESATVPATPTGGSWSFTTNTGTPPTGWSNTPPATPTNPVYMSIALVNSRAGGTLTWSVPGQIFKQGPTGPTGLTGPTGPQGPQGNPGTAATIAAGTTTTGAAGTSASVTNSGTSSAAVFNFTIPRGDTGATGATGATGSPGAAATIAVGTTTTGAAGTSASVTNSGTSSAAVFNFTIPRGDTGATGATGAAATVAAGTTTTGAPGSSASVTNSGTSSAAVFNFTIPRGDTGATGAGVPTGGTAGQALTKIDSTNYNTQWTSLGTMASQNANAVAITGGSVDNTSIGATTRSSGDFTTLSANTVTNTTPVLSFNASNSIASFGSTTPNSYNQLVIQNKSNTAGASTNYVLSNNLGTDSTYYGEFGMNASTYSSGTPADFFSLNNGVYFSAHDGDVTVGSGNGFKTYLAWGTSGQSAHVINASGAIGLNTNITGTTNFGTAGQVLTSGGSSSTPTWTTPTTGTVISVTGTAPVVSSGGATPAISMAAATTSVNGYLTSTDWTTFNNKQAALVSGTNIKTVNSTTLLGSGNLAVGTVTSVGGTGTVNGLTLTGTVTTSGNLTLGGTLDLSSPPIIGGTTAAAITGTTITGTKFVGISGGTF